jgi:ribonuclease HI
MPRFRHSPRVTDRIEIRTDGTFNNQTGVGGWAAVVARTSTGRQEGRSSYEMELCALIEAAKIADGPCTIVTDHKGIIGVANRSMTPRMCRPL